jgi:hypothetical protein
MTDDMATGGTTVTVTASGMIFALTSGTLYNFEFDILHNGNTTCGLKLGLTFPAATVVGALVEMPQTTTTMQFATLTATGQVITGSSSPGNTVPTYNRICGTIKPSANGNLAVIWGAEVSTTGGVQIMQGSAGFLYAL